MTKRIHHYVGTFMSTDGGFYSRCNCNYETREYASSKAAKLVLIRDHVRASGEDGGSPGRAVDAVADVGAGTARATFTHSARLAAGTNG